MVVGPTNWLVHALDANRSKRYLIDLIRWEFVIWALPCIEAR
jgi:hypothetical protein